MHQVFDALEFRVLRDRLYATLEAADARGRRGLRGDVHASSATARWRRGSTRTRGPAVAPACTSPATGDAGTGDVTGVALATGDGEGAWFDPPSSGPADEQAFAAWLADASRPKALHDAKGPSPGLRRARLAAAPASRATPRCRRTSRCPTSAATTWPTSRCATSSASCAPRATTDGQLAFGLDGGEDTTAAESDVLRARAVLELADALDTELEAKAATPLLRDVELPLVERARRDGAHRHRRRHRPPRARSSRSSRATVKDAADEAYAVIGKEINLGSPKQLQVRALRRARHAEDQAHQDRLHHRRRRAAGPVTCRPSTRSSPRCCATATRPGSRSPSTGCSRRSPTTAASTRRSTR